jgi:flagellar hook assembly protein FlgD
MINAMIHGVSENGNHLITCFGNVYHFYYRGTLIYKWDAINDKGHTVPAGKYEDTMSTSNQRREIKKAIENFKATVFEV